VSYRSPSELYRARIYDSEGLEYGFVCGFKLEDEPLIRACIEFPGEVEYPDVEALKQMITDLGYEVTEEIGLEELILIARKEGLKIPYTKSTTIIRLVKGIVKPEEIMLVDTVYRRREMDDMRISIILLNNPREARYRGYKVPYGDASPVKPQRVYGKLVVDVEEGILGWASTIVFGRGGIGLRIDTRFTRSGRINYDDFINRLKTVEIGTHDKLIHKIQFSGVIDLSWYGLIWEKLEEAEASPNACRILNESVELEPYYVEYRDIEWKNIIRINDIVLTRISGSEK
jgi:hypothetical protein